MEYIFYVIYRGIFFFYLILLFITGIKDIKTKQIKNGIPITMIIIAILYRLLEIKLKQNLFENGNGGIGFCLGGFPFFLNRKDGRRGCEIYGGEWVIFRRESFNCLYDRNGIGYNIFICFYYYKKTQKRSCLSTIFRNRMCM